MKATGTEPWVQGINLAPHQYARSMTGFKMTAQAWRPLSRLTCWSRASLWPPWERLVLLRSEGKVSRAWKEPGSSIQVAADRTEISISPRAEITQRPIET